MEEMDNIYKWMQDRQNSAKERILHNKEVLFDVLKKNNILSVSANFDGGGDSGSVEDVETQPGEKENVLIEPVFNTKVLKQIQYSAAKGQEFILEENPITIRELIEAIGYDFLEFTACGWETNEGSYGTFLFDCERKKVYLEISRRSVECEEHEL